MLAQESTAQDLKLGSSIDYWLISLSLSVPIHKVENTNLAFSRDLGDMKHTENATPDLTHRKS